MLDIRLLGPVEVWADGRRAPLGGTRPLAVLSALVVHLGEVLSTERLVDCVWDDEAPATAGALVATHVSAVRRALATVGEAGVIRTRPPGYVAALPPSGIDARRFEELLASGRSAAGRGRPEEAAELLSEALGLWRGREALEGLGQSFARIEAARLTELRLTGQEDHVDLLLALGHADRTIAPLLTQVADHPLRERPRAQLMTALFRTGRVSDALLTYQEAREVLREELGVDPGPELRALHRAVLTNDPALLGPAPRTAARPPAASPEAAGHAGTDPRPGPAVPDTSRPSPAEPVPSHLPPDIADFVGRTTQIAWAEALLGKVADSGRTAPPVGVVSGRSGSGKTALAVHVGHRTAGLFPDGLLFVDLRAADAAPVRPADALARLLRAMGAAPETLPTSVEELTGLYRTHVGHRRVLLILDNAAGEAHVRPLLPPGGGSAVLVTSRRRLVALEGAAHLDLTVPEVPEALELLAKVAGPSRTGAEPERAAEIVALCGRLPLAVRIAGARLASRPHWGPGRLAERLRDERRRLNELRAGDLELRVSLGLGYADLDPHERAVLRRLALLDLPDFAGWIAAPLLGIGVEEAEEAVERLVDCHFVDVVGVDGTGRSRYRIHDLAREHARERCLAEEEPSEREAAVLRLVASWLGLAKQAAARGPGGASRYFPEPETVRALDAHTEEELLARPAAWFAAEQAGLLAAVEYCAAHGVARPARDLAGALIASSAALYNRFDAWSSSHRAAMAAVRRGGDVEGEAWLLTGLGRLAYEQDRFEESYACFERALRRFGEYGDVPRGEAVALDGMATVRREQAGYPEALKLLGDALERYERTGDLAGRARTLYGFGYVHREQGRGEQARRSLTRALELYRAGADPHGEALTLRALALCHRAEGSLEEAERLLREARDVFTGLADDFGLMYTEQSLAKVELRTGRAARARARLDRCLAVARERQDRFGVALVLRTLGECHLATGDTGAAREPLERALAEWEALRLPVWRARTAWDLAEVWAADGRQEEAHAARAEALAVFRELDCREARERA
ncbi:BTAD domain-containing putative transcriptional regulator [Streptomyces sp. PG2]